MASSWFTLKCFACSCVLLAAVGCSPASGPTGQSSTGGGSGAAADSASQDIRDDLRRFATVYLDHHDVHGKGPESWEAMLAFAAEREQPTEPIQRVRDAGYQITWGASIRDATEGVDNYVIAESPSGGPKLMISGAILP